jgi:phosphoglycerol transferase MdoB-like AlkP superfamily enzyme
MKENYRVTELGLLGVAFIILKLCGVIDWSWWWVTAPFWGGLALVAIGTFIYILIKLIAKILESRNP